MKQSLGPLRKRAYIKIIILSVTVVTVFSFDSKAQISRNFTKKDKPVYELGFGMVGLSVPNYPGAQRATFRAIPFPWVIYRGEYLKADEEGNRVQFLRNDQFELGVSGGFNFPIDSDDNKAREGMPNAGALLGVGPSLIYRFPYDGGLQRVTVALGLRMNFVYDEGELRDQGFLVEPSIRYWVKSGRQSSLTFFTSLSFSFADKKYHEFFYQVESQYVTTKREEYEAKAGMVDIASSLGLSYELNSKVSLFGGLYYSNLSLASNKRSPLVENEHNIGYAVGVAWMFYETTQYD